MNHLQNNNPLKNAAKTTAVALSLLMPASEAYSQDRDTDPDTTTALKKQRDTLANTTDLITPSFSAKVRELASIHASLTTEHNINPQLAIGIAIALYQGDDPLDELVDVAKVIDKFSHSQTETGALTAITSLGNKNQNKVILTLLELRKQNTPTTELSKLAAYAFGPEAITIETVNKAYNTIEKEVQNETVSSLILEKAFSGAISEEQAIQNVHEIVDFYKLLQETKIPSIPSALMAATTFELKHNSPSELINHYKLLSYDYKKPLEAATLACLCAQEGQSALHVNQIEHFLKELPVNNTLKEVFSPLTAGDSIDTFTATIQEETRTVLAEKQKALDEVNAVQMKAQKAIDEAKAITEQLEREDIQSERRLLGRILFIMGAVSTLFIGLDASGSDS